jgi:cytochrome c oxidase subunit 2
VTRPSAAWWIPIVLLLAGHPAPVLGGDPPVVEITARRFEFTPAKVTLRAGQVVTLRLRSLDVTHGFFQKPLGIDTTIEPGKATDVTITPGTPGSYTVICDHFCGAGHGNMHMEIVVE